MTKKLTFQLEDLTMLWRSGNNKKNGAEPDPPGPGRHEEAWPNIIQFTQ